MDVRLAGLKILIGGHLRIYIPPGVGSFCHSFFVCYVCLIFDEGYCYFKREKKRVVLAA
jgi:hypothetical protein